jgi:D-3-phosphoglycerate dehydrogenase
MEKGKILFIDTAHQALMQELTRDGYQCEYFPEKDRRALKKIVKNYTGLIIRSKIILDKNFLGHAKKLRFIGRVGAGMENIDVDFAQSIGIKCLNAPEGNRDAVAEQAIGMLLMLFNNLLTADKEVRKGIWLREENRGIELGGKTVGIIGYGNTGGAFARKLSGFGVEVLAYDKYKSGFTDDFVTESSMEALFEKSDILSLHVPLTEETTYLVNDTFIHRFQKSIYLVNTSRGKVLKTADLVKNLQSGKVKGVCLDVLEYEGLSFENLTSGQLPTDFEELVKMPNVILSPHIAGWTHESSYKMAMILVEKIRTLGL